MLLQRQAFKSISVLWTRLKNEHFYFTAAEMGEKKDDTDTIRSFVNTTFLFLTSFVFNQITVIFLLR